MPPVFLFNRDMVAARVTGLGHEAILVPVKIRFQPAEDFSEDDNRKLADARVAPPDFRRPSYTDLEMRPRGVNGIDS